MFSRNNSMYDVTTFYKFLFQFWGTKSPKLIRLFRSYDKVSEKICGAISKFSVNLFSNSQWISVISFCWQSLIVTNYIDSLFLTSILLLLDCHVIGFYGRNRVYVVFRRDRCFVDGLRLEGRSETVSSVKEYRIDNTIRKVFEVSSKDRNSLFGSYGKSLNCNLDVMPL